jgi:hypothetical protein
MWTWYITSVMNVDLRLFENRVLRRIVAREWKQQKHEKD